MHTHAAAMGFDLCVTGMRGCMHLTERVELLILCPGRDQGSTVLMRRSALGAEVQIRLVVLQGALGVDSPASMVQALQRRASGDDSSPATAPAALAGQPVSPPSTAAQISRSRSTGVLPVSALPNSTVCYLELVVSASCDGVFVSSWDR